jgi:hypothetical protein
LGFTEQQQVANTNSWEQELDHTTVTQSYEIGDNATWDPRVRQH